jgi:[protein-PII] uridylyltransferase
MDAAVISIFERAAPPTGFAVLATGGYGRCELAPRSDLDLLLLRRDDADPAPLEGFLRALWDAGVEPGSAVRTGDQAIAALSTDLHAATATLEGRFLAGERALFLELRERIHGSFLPANAARFLKAKLDETDERHAKRGGTIFLLAPDLKEGRGTLRDLELARLMAALAPALGQEEARLDEDLFQARESPFVLAGLPRADEALARWLGLGKERVRALARAQALLAATRAAVHELEPVRTERLAKAVQDAIASRFGYRERHGRLGVENFLRDVYLAARAIDRTLRLARDRLERDVASFPVDPGTRRVRGARAQRLAPGIVATGDERSRRRTASSARPSSSSSPSARSARSRSRRARRSATPSRPRSGTRRPSSASAPSP